MKAPFISGSSSAFDDSFIFFTKDPDLTNVEDTPYLEEELQSGLCIWKVKNLFPFFCVMMWSKNESKIKPDKNTAETYILQSDQDTEYITGGNKFVLDKIMLKEKQFTVILWSFMTEKIIVF